VLERNGEETFNLKWKNIIVASGTDGEKVGHVYVPFNDWGEGIGIEPVSNTPPERMEGYINPFNRVPKYYYNMSPLSPDIYLKTCFNLAKEFKESR